MQPASEKYSYLEELSCKEDSLKENRFCFKQNQDSKVLCKIHTMKRNFFPAEEMQKVIWLLREVERSFC